MANRFPLIVDSTTGTVQELPSGDSLDLTGGGIVNATQIDIVAEGDLRLQDASGGQYVALDAPATVGSSYTLTLPAADGSSGQAITTDGSGALSFTSVGTADGSISTAKLADDAVTSAKIADDAITSALIADDAVVAAAIADNAVDIARLNVSDGSSGQVLTTNGSGTLSFATVGGAYTAWSVKTTTYTASSKDQLIANHASTPFTITLPSSPSAGDTVIVANAGAATVTIGRNSSNINSAAEDGSLPQGNSAQLVYVDGTIG